MPWSNQMETEALNWVLGEAARSPVYPLEMRLVTANGDGATAGTEAVGDLYEPQTVTWNAATAVADSPNQKAQATLIGTVAFDGISSTDAVDIAGIEMWDAAGYRMAWYPFPSPVTAESEDGLTLTGAANTVTIVGPYGIDSAFQRHLLNWMLGNSTTTPVPPLKIRPVLPNGTNVTAGSEHPGDLWEEAEVSFAAATVDGGRALALNDLPVMFAGLDAAGASEDYATIRAFEVWDSAASRKRILYREIEGAETAFTPPPGEGFFLAPGGLAVRFGTA